MDFLKDFFKNTDRPFPRRSDKEFPESESYPRQEYDDIFSESFNIHDFFENQINEIFKSFSFSGFPTIVPEPSFDSTGDNAGTQSLRDQFLKDGHQKSKQKNGYKTDQDLDGKVIFGNLGPILEENITEDQQYHEFKKGGNLFSSQIQSFKAITLPDGTVQTENVRKDQEGNEEKVVCHQLGIKQYCVIRRKDKYGKDEVTENFINISEEEKEKFSKAYRNM